MNSFIQIMVLLILHHHALQSINSASTHVYNVHHGNNDCELPSSEPLFLAQTQHKATNVIKRNTADSAAHPSLITKINNGNDQVQQQRSNTNIVVGPESLHVHGEEKEVDSTNNANVNNKGVVVDNVNVESTPQVEPPSSIITDTATIQLNTNPDVGDLDTAATFWPFTWFSDGKSYFYPGTTHSHHGGGGGVHRRRRPSGNYKRKGWWPAGSANNRNNGWW